MAAHKAVGLVEEHDERARRAGREIAEVAEHRRARIVQQPSTLGGDAHVAEHLLDADVPAS